MSGAYCFLGFFIVIPAFLAASGNEGYGIFGILPLLGILGFLHYQICIRSFGLITHLPDHVARWFGHSGERLGEEGHNGTLVAGMVNRVENNAKTFGGAGLMPKSGGGGGGGGGPQVTEKGAKTANSKLDSKPASGGGGGK